MITQEDLTFWIKLLLALNPGKVVSSLQLVQYDQTTVPPLSVVDEYYLLYIVAHSGGATMDLVSYDGNSVRLLDAAGQGVVNKALIKSVAAIPDWCFASGYKIVLV